MVVDFFESLLQELGQILGVKDLHLDQNNSCLISTPDGMKVQLEPHEKEEAVLLCIDIGIVPPGLYREGVFKESLKANGLLSFQWGYFAYSDQTDHLLLLAFLPYQNLNGEKIAEFLVPFLDKGRKWTAALEKGEIPLATSLTTEKPVSTLFGIKR